MRQCEWCMYALHAWMNTWLAAPHLIFVSLVIDLCMMYVNGGYFMVYFGRHYVPYCMHVRVYTCWHRTNHTLASCKCNREWFEQLRLISRRKHASDQSNGQFSNIKLSCKKYKLKFSKQNWKSLRLVVSTTKEKKNKTRTAITRNLRKRLQTYIRVCETRSLWMLHSMLAGITHARPCMRVWLHTYIDVCLWMHIFLQ
jgi:hypothetical protein